MTLNFPTNSLELSIVLCLLLTAACKYTSLTCTKTLYQEAPRLFLGVRQVNLMAGSRYHKLPHNICELPKGVNSRVNICSTYV